MSDDSEYATLLMAALDIVADGGSPIPAVVGRINALDNAVQVGADDDVIRRRLLELSVWARVSSWVAGGEDIAKRRSEHALMMIGRYMRESLIEGLRRTQ